MARPPRRFNVNPAEFVAFVAVMGVFANSAYQVFHGWDEGLKDFAWVSADPNSNLTAPPDPARADETPGDRHPASMPEAETKPTTVPFATLEVACAGGTIDIGGARRARLNGNICGESGGTLLRAEIVNEATGAEANVFADAEVGRFSTDYIPMRPGDNTVHLRFVYEGGQIASSRVTLTRDQ